MKLARVATGVALAGLMATGAHAFELQSSSSAFLAKPATEITDNPTVGEWNACFPASEDFSPSGKLIAEKDWVITSEVEFEGFELVSFAGIAKEVADGACEFSDGYVAISRDGKMLGLIENANTDHQLLSGIRPAKDGVVAIVGNSGAQPTGAIRYEAAADRITVSAE